MMNFPFLQSFSPSRLVPVLWAILLSLFLACAKVLSNRISLLRKPLPPGPPFLFRWRDGNNNEHLALKFTRWSQAYGGVMTVLDAVHLGEATIVLGTAKAAMDILEKRGSIYSSRPRNIIAGEICYRGMKGTLQPMGGKLKRFRALMHSIMNMRASKEFRPLEDAESKILLRDLLVETNPARYGYHVQRLVHSVAFCTAYGLRMDRLDPEFLKFYRKLETFFRGNNLPGGYLVDHLPMLLHLPRRLQWFRKEADAQGNREERFVAMALSQTKAAVSKGFPVSGSAARALQSLEKYDHDLEVAWMASAPYTAGLSALGSYGAFTLAMLLHPRVMKKAQEEIDAVVGPYRMPDFEDYDSLPYLQAVIKETLRWHPPAPFALAHSATEDDVYEGMFIPAGSTVMANVYGITRDEELFPDPEEFRPERFVDNHDPVFKNYTITFGFGRRICPGQHITRDQLYTFMSRVIWAFDIIPLDHNLDIVNHPAKHKPRIGSPAALPHKFVPRSDTVRSIILQEGKIAEEEAKVWESFVFR